MQMREMGGPYSQVSLGCTGVLQTDQTDGWREEGSAQTKGRRIYNIAQDDHKHTDPYQ